VNEEYRLIPLTGGHFAKVDPEDYERLAKWKWRAHPSTVTGKFYATRGTKVSQKCIFITMHREILGLKLNDGILSDHINRDTLDNRKCNLRPATRHQNRHNSGPQKNNKSGFKGVYQASPSRFVVQVNIGGKRRKIGSRPTAERAYWEVYVPAVKQLHGEFACIQQES
jgi:hypothetical protein